MTLATIPPAERPAHFARELRAVFPSAQKLKADVGIFTVEVRYNHAQAWATLSYSDGTHTENFANLSLSAGLARCRERIEDECRRTLLLAGIHPDGVTP